MRCQIYSLIVFFALLALPVLAGAQMSIPIGNPGGIGTLGISAPSLGGEIMAKARCHIQLTGRIFPEGQAIPKDLRVVRLRIGEAVVPMVLDPEGENPYDPKYQAFRFDRLKEVYDSLLRITVAVQVEHKDDMAQLEGRRDSSDALRVDGCARGWVMPVFEISSVRRSH